MNNIILFVLINVECPIQSTFFTGTEYGLLLIYLHVAMFYVQFSLHCISVVLLWFSPLLNGMTCNSFARSKKKL